MPNFIYDYSGFSFTLSIPEYWSKIYRGKPREKLYHDYTVMLDKIKTIDYSKVIIDVGVNHGIFSIPAAMLGYTVVGFEPVEENFNNVLEAIKLNKVSKLDIYNIALSNKLGEVDIYVPECPDNASLNKEAAIANMKGKEFDVEVVTAMKFDDWIKQKPQYTNIGFIKIDVQGSEYKVIEGMEEYLGNAHDIYLLVEFEDHLLKMGYTYDQLDTLITSLGFIEQPKITGGDRLYFKP